MQRQALPSKQQFSGVFPGNRNALYASAYANLVEALKDPRFAFALECGGGNPAQVQSRRQRFRAVCGALGVAPGAKDTGC